MKKERRLGSRIFMGLIFLFLGNLFPFMAFYYLNILGKSDGLGAIVFLMLFQPVFYAIVVWKLCTKKEILDTGLIAYAVRLVIAGFAYWAVMLAASFLMSHVGIFFLILAAAAAVLAAVKLLISVLNREIDEAAEDYRRYYTNFDARKREWSQMVRSSVEKKAKQLSAELNACERRKK